jgi:hypothetical protein
MTKVISSWRISYSFWNTWARRRRQRPQIALVAPFAIVTLHSTHLNRPYASASAAVAAQAREG